MVQSEPAVCQTIYYSEPPAVTRRRTRKINGQVNATRRAALAYAIKVLWAEGYRGKAIRVLQDDLKILKKAGQNQPRRS
jgi:hypothetical protein